MIRRKIKLDTEELKALGDERLTTAYKKYNELLPKFTSIDGKTSRKELLSMHKDMKEYENIMKGLVITTEIY